LPDGARVLNLTSLVSIENAKFKSFEEAETLERCISCSWGESKLLKRAQTTDSAIMTKFTKRHLLRCYPAGHRVMSDNYEPSAAWSVGAQMVALNFQANDLPMWLNRGKFKPNGGCGYIKKPSYLLDENAIRPMYPYTLEVTILGGCGWDNFKDADLFDAPDTYVKVIVSGNLRDAMTRCTTTYKPQKRTGPEAQPWYNESFNFTIYEHELALLMFVVYDRDTASQDDFLGQYCTPVSLIKSGTRAVPLFSAEGKYVADDSSGAALLVHIRYDGGTPYACEMPLIDHHDIL